jgi:hypothetical protein
MSSRQVETAAAVRKRNLIVLLALVAFVAFAFALSFRHVTSEMGAGVTQRAGTTK